MCLHHKGDPYAQGVGNSTGQSTGGWELERCWQLCRLTGQAPLGSTLPGEGVGILAIVFWGKNLGMEMKKERRGKLEEFGRSINIKVKSTFKG
jgi:hypothetical protein